MSAEVRPKHGQRVDAMPAWKRDVLRCAIQSPLLKTRASVRGLTAMREPPRAVTLGIGLSSRHTLSQGLPFDVLGMLLAAEQLRRAAKAERVVALIADRHALTNGFASHQIEARACEVQRRLRAVRDALGLRLEILRADTLHRTRDHQSIVRDLQRRAGPVHPYVKLEVADTEYLRRNNRAIVKLGWALDAGGRGAADALDERHFDERFREWIGSDIGFAYVRPGRTLDLRRPTAAPYLVLDAGHRLLLSPHESVDGKLTPFLQSAPKHARCALHGHLRRITAVYSRTIAPLEGPVPQRVRSVLDHIFNEQPTFAAARERA